LQLLPESERLARGADEIAQGGDVWAVRADAAGVYGKPQTLGEIEIHAGIIEFRQAETRGGLDAIQSRRIDGTRRTVAMPWTARQFVELFPITFVPSIHRAI
jgi:hypothetical protein